MPETARERLHVAILNYGEARWKMAIAGEVGTAKQRASAEAEVATALSTIEREIDAAVREAVEENLEAKVSELGWNRAAKHYAEAYAERSKSLADTLRQERDSALAKLRTMEVELDLMKQQLQKPASVLEQSLRDYIATINLNVPEQYRQPQLDLSMVRMREAVTKQAALVERLRDDIEAALRPLGTGECSVGNCDACEYEQKEAITILRKALAAIPDSTTRQYETS